MAKKIKFPIPKEDIPAWFVTYSDVVTLLMTFFILLLTFATTEPEKFDRISSVISNAQSASGSTGKPVKGQAKEAWVNRIRPASGRIATQGAGMPPISHAPVKESFGSGLKALQPDENKHNEIESHYFDIELNQVFDQSGQITPQGQQILAALATQLRDLPFQAAIQYSNPDHSDKVVNLMLYMFELEKIRPGQLGMTLTRNKTLTHDRIRILIKRFLVKPA